MTAFTGTSGNEVQDGTGSSDSFDYSQGGDDTLNGKGGDDSFYMGSELTGADAIDGGDGNDTVYLDGFFSATFSATTMVNVESLVFGSGIASITTDDATVAAGQIMTIDGNALFDLYFDGSRETDGSFLMDGGEGNDSFFAGQGNDFINGNNGDDFIVAGQSGTQHLDGGEGGDEIHASGDGIYFVDAGIDDDFVGFGGTIAVNHQLDGGAGFDVLSLEDTVYVDAPTFSVKDSHFENVFLNSNDFVIGNDGNNVIDFSGVQVDGGEGFVAFTIQGGGGNDTLTGSNIGESIYGGSGTNVIKGLGGNDSLYAGADQDTVYGGAGGDRLYGDLGVASLYGGSGNDWIYADFGGLYTVDAGTGSDVVQFTGVVNAPNQILGGAGIDTLRLFGDVSVQTATFTPAALGFEKVLILDSVTVTGDGDDNTIDFSGIPVSVLSSGRGGATALLDGAIVTINGGGGSDTLTGSNLDDAIYGGAGTNVLTGLGGDDALYAGTDHDTMYGGNGDDQLVGDAGTATMYGGAGKDTIDAWQNGLYTVDGGDDNDVVNFAGTVNTANQILGGAGIDALRLVGDVSIETANFTPAALGFERVVIFDSVTVTGDDADNTIDFSGIPVSVLSSARDGFSLLDVPALTIDGGSGGDTLTGSNLDDAIYGGAGTNVMSGLNGNDALFAGPDDDTMYGGDGNDTLYGDTGHAVMNGDAGKDTIYADNGGDYTVDAGAGADTVFFAGTVSAPNQIKGGAGTDTLKLSGDVSVETANFTPAALGFESVVLLDAITVTGDDNNNTIDFSGLTVTALPPDEEFDGGSLQIEGAGGDDTLTGSNLGEAIYGGEGNNTLSGLGGADTLDVSDSIGTNSLYGGAGGDLLNAGGGNDTLDGAGGDDHLVGGGGNATMYGGDDNDLIEANHGGFYTVDAGAGNDEVRFAGSVNSLGQLAGGLGNDDLVLSGTVTVNTTQFSPQGSGFETVHIGSGVSVVAGTATTIDFSGVTTSGNVGSVLNFTGSLSSDTITGSNWADAISGGGGNDIVDGGASGNDTMNGGSGFNRLSFAHSATAVNVSLATSGVAQDVGGGRMLTISNFRFLDGSHFGDHLTGDGLGNLIDGAAGDDFITGGLGADSLVGGDDADTFIYLSVDDSSPGALGRDIIDFHHAQHDTIDLSAIDANTNVANDQAFHLVAGTFTHAAGELVQLLDNGQTVIAGDVNGDAVADFEIQLTNAQTLVNGDFTF